MVWRSPLRRRLMFKLVIRLFVVWKFVAFMASSGIVCPADGCQLSDSLVRLLEHFRRSHVLPRRRLRLAMDWCSALIAISGSSLYFDILLNVGLLFCREEQERKARPHPGIPAELMRLVSLSLRLCQCQSPNPARI